MPERNGGPQAAGNGDSSANSNPSIRAPSLAPLTRWPPVGISIHEELPHQDALELIARGAPTHKGRKEAIPHAPDQFYALYATTSGTRSGRADGMTLHDAMAQLMTMRMHGQGYASHPWETLEQPSHCFYFGKRPGTVTLNQWVAMASVIPPKIALRDPGAEPRPVLLGQVFQRLKELQGGLEDDNEPLMYRNLYKRFLRDPDKIFTPHKTLDRQITDLITVLSRNEWFDFTEPKNQVVTRFIFDTAEENHAQYLRFFHQLLLSLELELRIHSGQHGDWAKEKLLHQIPPRIQWNLALARRWRENVRVESYGDTPDQVKLRYKLKKRQVKQLKRFAQIMKWPNLKQTMDYLTHRDELSTLDTISSDAFAFFSGLVLPGPTLTFLMMNTLIDVDPDEATDELALLSHMHPHCGFQYRNSHTYWTASCIVGKVIAPTCGSVAGWVGPGRPTPDLGRSQIARIRTRQAKQRMEREDVESMAERSGPLGPEAESYPVHEYTLPLLDQDSGVVDTIRVEVLNLKPVTPTARDGEAAEKGGPRIFDAVLQFAVDGASWPLRLMYDVSFVTAWPCVEGPHALFYDYAHQLAKVDEILKIRNWGGLYSGHDGAASGSSSARSSPAPELLKAGDEDFDDEKVLVVDAIGVRDNEVLARAWCSHWGLSAIVADVKKTCMACAIREAYAATLTVVILVEDQGSYYIGIDVGTGSARACIIDDSGDIKALAAEEIRLWQPEPGYYEQSTTDIWQRICECVRKIMAESGVAPSQVKGIGFDATCSLAVLDKETGEPVTVTGPDFRNEGEDRNVVLWLDHRPVEETRKINATGHRLLKYVGGKMSIEMEIPKVLWLKNNMPAELFDRCKFYDLTDALTHLATGNETRSFCSTVCKQGYVPVGIDGSVKGWQEDFYQEIGLGDLVKDDFKRMGGVNGTSGKFASAGECVGTLSQKAAAQLGLVEGIAVGSGVIDAYAGWIGTVGAKIDAANGPNVKTDVPANDISQAFTRLAAVAGTSTCHLAMSREAVFVPGVWGPYRDVLVPDFWLAEGGQSATGELLRHMLDIHPAYQETLALAKADGKHIYDYLNERLEQLAAKQGAPAISWLGRHHFLYGDLWGNRSPIADPTMKGTMIGLDSDKSTDNMALWYYATMEFIAMQTRQIVEQMNAAGHEIASIFMSGSQCQNPVLMRLLATTCSMPVVIPEYVHAAVVHGAAMLGAKAASHTRAGAEAESLWAIMDRMSKPGRMVQPGADAGERALLDAKYGVFLDMCRTQQEYRDKVNKAVEGWGKQQ
ncbi:putative sugar kinase [Escovopsis weberi]|uniref:Putative sugar kinase n=1 Tax=Escovopsis weberi TaxID=150374 RepID=A0A0M8N968_ESCWE|nr:putative sugar kinase [Escovopsis weberi]